ncbi:MAG: class I SAM-dependent methyltransferase [Acidobacteria bacterium]|nr:class I SAM-dependent methyltransferase [Acidobacteriota bacterium]
MTQEHIDAWREALLLPGETDLIESGLRELAEYFGISRDEARRRCESALADSKREWESDWRRTPEEVKNFYRTSQSYIFEHVWWHATDLTTNADNVELLRFALRLGATRYLDFGSGVGANAILFARNGFNVTLADVSPPMLEFARWRLQRRGIEAALIDLNQRKLTDEHFDFVTAVDVFEHLPRPSIELRQLHRAMRKGGTLVFNCRTGEDNDRPMHVLKNDRPVWQTVRACGFRQIEAAELRRIGHFALRCVRQSRWKSWQYAVVDRARFSKVLMADNDHTGRRVIHPQRVYFDRIETLLQTDCLWLDVGCGRQIVPRWMSGGEEIERRLRSAAKLVVGADPDFAALGDNHSCHARAQIDSAKLPFADGSFDLVTANMVFEHVADPLSLLREIRRTLCSGGKLIVLTPNWLDIVSLTARAVPNRWHPGIVSRVETRSPAEVYPTHFRFNRPDRVASLLREAGFVRHHIELLEHPDAYSHVPIVARIEHSWHRLASRWPALRGVLLIEAE